MRRTSSPHPAGPAILTVSVIAVLAGGMSPELNRLGAARTTWRATPDDVI